MKGISFICITGIVLLAASAVSQGCIIRPFAEDSCEGRCNKTGTIPGTCQCNTACVRYNDCCPDYYSLCLGVTDSCVGRCQQNGTIPGTCQCNQKCVEYNDCCADYEDVCKPAGPPVSDQELEALSEQLLSLDTVNNATAYIKVDLQGKNSDNSPVDMAPLPLLTVQPAAFTRSTIQKLLALHDNYVADVSKSETYTAEELRELNDFTDAVFATPIMMSAQQFLQSKGLPSGKENFFTMWHGLYKRGATNSSSGFEHVFLGELKPDDVSGYHNWEFFNSQEEAKNLNYLGYKVYVDFGSRGSVIEHTFTWHGVWKKVSSNFIGISPELELALYTVCFHARPNAKCPVSLAGNLIKIQTYDMNGKYVGTAYPDLSN